MTITISHTAETGTLVEGTVRGDGSAEILKHEGWRWGRSISCWYLAQSRDRAPRRRTIERTGAQLRAAGFDVEIDIDDTYRPAAESEAAAIARQAHRVDALADRTERREAAGDAAAAAADRAHNALPPMGEPIKVGHHSERRHRSAIARADAAMRRSIEADQAAKLASERAATAAQTTDLRYSPGQVARRIERLDTDLRAWQRRLDGSSRRLSNGMTEVIPPAEGDYAVRARKEIDHLVDQIGYWRGIREQQIADGLAVEYARDTIRVGDLIRYAHVWGRVERVNAKSVTATGSLGKMIAPYTRIEGHRPQEDGGDL